MNSWISISLMFLLHSLCTTMAQQITGSETREPAFLLRPRNFNPHPYQSALQHSSAHRQDYYYGYPPPQYLLPIALDSSPERHPYNIIKAQRDYLNRPTTQVDKQAFSALANHGQRVLQEPQDDLNRKYEFSYTANDIYHSQQQDQHGLVKGSYEVPLPDGRIQVVQYTADHDGYHPEISYKGEAIAAAPQPTYVTAQSAQPVQRERGSVVVYPDEEEEEVPVEPPKSYYSTTTTLPRPHAVQYNDYGLISGLPKPFGTVRTRGPVQIVQESVVQPKYGHIQYATYEEQQAGQSPTVYYEKK